MCYQIQTLNAVTKATPTNDNSNFIRQRRERVRQTRTRTRTAMHTDTDSWSVAVSVSNFCLLNYCDYRVSKHELDIILANIIHILPRYAANHFEKFALKYVNLKE